MSRESVLADGREFVEEGFTETVTFFYTEPGEIPEGDINPVDVEIAVHSDVPALVKYPSLNVSPRESAGQMLGVQDITVKVAVASTPGVHEGHFCRVISSTVDPTLVGRKFRVSGWPQSGQVTSHRYPLEEA